MRPVHESELRRDGPGPKTRRAMRVANVEGVLASASDNFAGPYVSLYALSLGASNAQIGLVNAVPALVTNLLQMPFAILSDRLARRKAFWVIGGFGLRFAWLPAALIPLFAVTPGTAVAAYIGLLALKSLFAAAATPAWTSLMADMTPRRMRGAYFSNRNILVNFSALAATLASGAVLRLFGAPVGYQATFLIAAAFGAAAAWASGRFPDLDAQRRMRAVGEPRERTGAGGGVRKAGGLLAAVRREMSFTSYSLASALWNFGVTLPQPLFAVYFVEALGGTASFWGVVSASVFVTTILGQRYWGGLFDRLGGRNVLVAAGSIVTVIPGLWFVAFRAEHALWINLLSGLGWAGFNLAAFNLLLEVTPDRGRAAYVAGYNALIGLAHFAGPLLGGVAADVAGARPVFLASVLIRLVAWWLFARRVKTAGDRPFEWGALLPWPRGGLRRLAFGLIRLPGRIARKLGAKRLERRLRRKVQRRLVAGASEEGVHGEAGRGAWEERERDGSGEGGDPPHASPGA